MTVKHFDRSSLHSSRWRTWRASGQLVALRATSALLQAATLTVAARISEPADLGRSLQVIALAAVLVPATDLGQTPALIRRVAANGGSLSAVGPAIAFRYLTALTAGALWALLATPFGPEAMLGGLLLASESIIAVQFGVLLAADRLGMYGCVLVGQRGVALAILSVGGSGTSLVAAYAVAAAVGATAMSAAARRQLRRDATRLVGSDVAALLREGRPFFVHSLGAQLANLDTPIVGAVAGDVVAGVYGLPSRLTNAVGLLATSSASVLLRESSAAGGDQLLLRRLIRDAAVLVGLIAAGLGALALVAEPLVVHLFGEDYRDAVTPLRLVLLAVAVASANTVVASILQGTGRAVRTGRAVLFGTIVGLGAVAVGALVGDATGAGVGLVVMQLVIAFGLVMPNPPLGRRSRPGTPEA